MNSIFVSQFENDGKEGKGRGKSLAKPPPSIFIPLTLWFHVSNGITYKTINY